jgi:hypothetical protein
MLEPWELDGSDKDEAEGSSSSESEMEISDEEQEEDRKPVSTFHSHTTVLISQYVEAKVFSLYTPPCHLIWICTGFILAKNNLQMCQLIWIYTV